MPPLPIRVANDRIDIIRLDRAARQSVASFRSETSTGGVYADFLFDCFNSFSGREDGDLRRDKGNPRMVDECEHHRGMQLSDVLPVLLQRQTIRTWRWRARWSLSRRTGRTLLQIQ